MSTKYDGILGVTEHKKNMLDEKVSQEEAKGHVVSTKYYQALSSNAQTNYNQLLQKRKEQEDALSQAVKSGKIKVGSQDWYSMVNDIDATTEELEKLKTQMLEYAKSIREVEWDVFDKMQESISNVADEAQFLIDLMGNKKLYEDNGQLTDEGKATMGLHAEKYNVYMAQAKNYAEEMKKVERQLAEDPYNEDVKDRLKELREAHQDAILSAEDEKDAIKDLVQDGIDKELDSLQDLIDKKNDALDSERDLYDYQKKVKEQTKDIASLEKQLASYANDTSEEAKAKIQKIKVDLQDAKDELQETEYDQYISDQQAMLDDLYDQYEEILNKRLDDIDALLADMTEASNNNADKINSTINDAANKVGYSLTTETKNIWNGSEAVGIVKSTNDVVSGIKTDTAAMIAALDKIAQTNVADANKSAKDSKAANDTSSGSGNGGKKTNTQAKKNSGSKSSGKLPYGKVSSVSATLKRGSKGNSVKALQYALNKLGYSKMNVDGIFGTKTDAAVRKFQKAMKIGVDGIVGKKTKAVFKKKGYESGKFGFLDDEIAWTQENGAEMIVRPSDGAILTPIARGDSVLTANASKNIWDMANNPADFIKGNLGLEGANAPMSSNGNTNLTQNFDKVVFNMPNVKNYDQMLAAMQKDRNFERLVTSMSVDRIAGKSSLAKGKAIR